MKINKEIILKSAIENVRCYGYEKAKLSWIANSLNISHATIYKYFQDKESLFESIVYYKMDTQTKQLNDYLKNSSTTLKDDIYKFLWMLSRIQREYFMNDEQIFLLMKHQYIHNEKFREEQEHARLEILNNLLVHHEIKENRQEIADNIMNSFVIFFVPFFSSRWRTDYYQAKFDSLFKFIIANNVILTGGTGTYQSDSMHII